MGLEVLQKYDSPAGGVNQRVPLWYLLGAGGRVWRASVCRAGSIAVHAGVITRRARALHAVTISRAAYQAQRSTTTAPSSAVAA